MTRFVPRLLLTMVVTLALALPGYSQVYLYTGGNPMAKMMLDFMEVMGFIHRLPDRYAANVLRGKNYSGWGGFPTSSLWGMSPYTGMTSLAAPMAMSSMMSQPGMGGWPMPGNVAGGMLPMNPLTYPGFTLPQTGRQPVAPVAENGKVQLSVDELQRLLANSRNNSANPARLAKSAAEAPAGTTVRRESHRTRLPLTQPTVTRHNQPVKTDELAGLWMGSGRDILTITADRFIWTDPKGRVTQGSFRIQGDTMLVQADEADAPAQYQISYSGDKMIATNKAGYRYEFTRAK